MASVESTEGKRQEAAKFSRIYQRGFSQIYHAVKKEFSQQGVFEVTQTQLWSCIVAEWQESYGEMNDSEIEILSVLFRLWILEKHWMMEDEIHTSVIGKAVRDGMFDREEAESKVSESAWHDVNVDDGKLESKGTGSVKKVYHEIVETVDGKPYLLEYCTLEERQQHIDEVSELAE